MIQPPSDVFTAIQAAFTRMAWQSRRVEDREIIEADFELHHTKVRVHVQAFAPLNALSVVATASHQVPDSRMGIIAELLMRTNLELTIGSFEMNYDDGRVHFRATNVFPPNRVDERIIASLVHSALAETDRLTPFITLVLRMHPEELGKLNLKLFLQREDLLPPVPEST
jgi:hypothetical protein